MKFRFNQEKAISVVLYISQRIAESGEQVGMHKIFKILYFADQKHLANWGRPITGDYFVAMGHGPVPSAIYDILKSVRGDNYFVPRDKFSEYFDVKEHRVAAKKIPDMELLSESEIAILNDSIKENVHLSFQQLCKKSHDQAWRTAIKDDKISFKCMAQIAGAGPEMLSYIRHNAENDSVFM